MANAGHGPKKILRKGKYLFMKNDDVNPLIKGKESIVLFLGELAYFTNEEEEKKAKEYLEYWKENTMNKLKTDVYHAELIDESFHVRGPEFSGMLLQRSSIAIKIAVRIKFRFEICPLSMVCYK